MAVHQAIMAVDHGKVIRVATVDRGIQPDAQRLPVCH
jgi:hypothetical protein